MGVGNRQHAACTGRSHSGKPRRSARAAAQ
jgi:hypothetical protein